MRSAPAPIVKSGSTSVLSPGRQNVLLWLIIALGLALRVWKVNWGLPELLEEAIPLRYSIRLWSIGTSGIDYHFFVYPALTYYIQFLIQALYYFGGHIAGTFPTLEAFLKA